jgi:hypothetical protein
VNQKFNRYDWWEQEKPLKCEVLEHSVMISNWEGIRWLYSTFSSVNLIKNHKFSIAKYFTNVVVEWLLTLTSKADDTGSNSIWGRCFYERLCIYLCIFIFIYFYIYLLLTSDPPGIRTGAMQILKLFSTILHMLYTYKPSSLIPLSIKKTAPKSVG